MRINTDSNPPELKLEHYRMLVEMASDGVWLLDKDFMTVYVNPMMAEMLGYPQQEMIGKSWYDFGDPEWVLRAQELEKRREGGIREPHEFLFIHKEGKKVLTRISTTPLFDKEGNFDGALGVLSDISMLKVSEETLKIQEMLNSIAKFSGIGMTIINPDYTIVWYNDLMSKWSGQLEKTKGRNCFEVIGKKEAICSDCPAKQIFETGKATVTECSRAVLSAEADRIFSLTASPIFDPNGRLIQVAVITQDITERRQAEDQIKASLKEKEILLQEVHHRVKNNLQVMGSLLRLQAAKIEDQKCTDMLEESQRRIKSIALVHERLYQSKDLARVDFGEYLKTLTDDLCRAYAINTDRIAIKLDTKQISFKPDLAIPCGLIISELVSNSLKYAFPDNRKGDIRIILSAFPNDKLELTVEDNGAGLPENIDFKSADSLGLELVNILVEGQLEGEIELDRTRGTRFIIRFSSKTLRKRS